MPRTPEAILKTEIRRYLTSIGAFWSSVQGGMGSKPGDPDIVVCHEGRYYAVEAKSSDGSLREMQRIRKGQIEDAGGVYIVARSVQDVADRIH